MRIDSVTPGNRFAARLATDWLVRKGQRRIMRLTWEGRVAIQRREARAETVPDLTGHPAIADSYLASLCSLEAAPRGPDGPVEAEEFAAVRDLVDSIIVTPNGADSAPLVEVVGDLARFLAPAGFSSGGKVVAEVRYRQSPRRTIPIRIQV